MTPTSPATETESKHAATYSARRDMERAADLCDYAPGHRAGRHELLFESPFDAWVAAETAWAVRCAQSLPLRPQGRHLGGVA